MPTDEERREVAERLRKLPSTTDADGCCTAWDVLFALGARQCDAIGFVRTDDALRLADLIDRPTCKLLLQEQMYSLWGEPIDDLLRFTLSCGHHTVGYEKPRYCLTFGAEVVE